ncbi:hypothetical protein HDU76_007142, partial [Blyttiomyces sp. JEL0837]
MKKFSVSRIPIQTALNVILIAAIILLFIWTSQNNALDKAGVVVKDSSASSKVVSKHFGEETDEKQQLQEQQQQPKHEVLSKADHHADVKCSTSLVYDEPKFDVFADGDGWANAYFKKVKEDVASGEAPLTCDLGKLSTPVHFVDVGAQDVDGKFKIALHPPGTDVFVSDTMREHGVPFEAGFHHLFQSAFHAIARLTKRDPDSKMLVVDAGGNIGAHSLFFAKLNHEVHTFEPFIKNMRLLRCSAQINHFTNLYLHRLALSNATTATRMCLNAPEGNVGGTTLSEECGQFNHKEASNYETSTDIRTVRLDEFWKAALGSRRP